MENMTEITPKKKSPKKDRSNGKYSEEAFRALPRDRQFELAKKYWGGPVKDFDDGTFQFSATHFGDICKSLGFEKQTVITDTLAANTIYLEHGTRDDTVDFKIKVVKNTNAKKELFFSRCRRPLSNNEKSKIMEIFINEMLDAKIEALESGNLIIKYKEEDLF